MGSVGLALGSQAVDFHLKGVDGRSYRLQDFADKKAVVVMFSCNHCPYVRDYEARMVELQRDYSTRGVTLVAINSNDDHNYREDSFEKMIQRSKEKGFNFPYLRDETQDIARKYGAICTPHVFAFDQHRKLQYKGRIDDNRNVDEVKTKDLRNALDAILEGRKPPIQETRPFGCSIKWKN
ncbi:thioredoxin family protein [Candidatus Bathyarchaeota archaeon]|nr:thioredoxin family protein [Candidatus Bathyarchaeota archaeon]